MAIEDYVEPEIAVAVALTAAVCSPKVRKVLRTGLVYGVAGALTATEMATTFAAGLSRNIRQATDESARKNGDEDATVAEQPKAAPRHKKDVPANE